MGVIFSLELPELVGLKIAFFVRLERDHYHSEWPALGGPLPLAGDKRGSPLRLEATRLRGSSLDRRVATLDREDLELASEGSVHKWSEMVLS